MKKALSNCLSFRYISSNSRYIKYTHKAIRKKEKNEYNYEIKVPLVRIAFDIVMRTRFDFFLGVYNASYNMKLQQFFRHCGITREVCVENLRTNEAEMVPFCDVVTQGIIHRMHIDLLYEADGLRGLRGGFYNGAKKMSRYTSLPVKDYFKKLNKALGQMPFKADQNFNIVEGTPFVRQDVFVYREQPDKLPGGRTNPYIITELQPLAPGEGAVSERVEVKYGQTLLQERKVAVCGKQYLEFLDSMEDGARQWIQYGLMLLKKVSDFKLPFVQDLGETLYELRTVYRWHNYSSIFYLNGNTLVFLHGSIEKKRKRQPVAAGLRDKLMDIRWKNVVGEIPSVEYDSVLDEQFGATGSVKREVWEMRACSSYVSQAISQARVNAGLGIRDIAVRLGLKPNTR